MVPVSLHSHQSGDCDRVKKLDKGSFFGELFSLLCCIIGIIEEPLVESLLRRQDRLINKEYIQEFEVSDVPAEDGETSRQRSRQ
jgi:hypothetical protein